MFKKQPGYIKKNIINVLIWHNAFITVTNKSFFISVLSKHGIKLVWDFLSANGALLTCDIFYFYTRLTCLMYMSCNTRIILVLFQSFQGSLCWKSKYWKKNCTPFLPMYFEVILLNENYKTLNYTSGHNCNMMME